MGIPARHSGAPYADGETLAGADLETDIANIVTEMGNIQNVNVASGAAIAGSKLADASITGTKLVASTVTKDKIADGAITQCYISSVTQSGAAMTTATTYQNVPSVAAATLTPAAVNDMIELDFTCTVAATTAAALSHYFTFSVDGTDQPALVRVQVPEMTNTSVDQYIPVHVSFADRATATTAMVLRPRYKASATTVVGLFPGDVNMVFRARIIPQ